MSGARRPSPEAMQIVDAIAAGAIRDAELVGPGAGDGDSGVAGVVELLTEALEKARRGEFVGVVVIGATPDDQVDTAYEVGSGWAALIAGAAIVQQQLISEAE